MDTQPQTQARSPRRFFETMLGGFTIAAGVLAAVGVLVYMTQFANPSYEERKSDAELACAEHIDLDTAYLDTSEFDDCVAYEMGR